MKTTLSNTVLSFVLSIIFVSNVLTADQGEIGRPRRDEVKPNIILLMGDDHGWEETGYNGHPDLKTPVLDEMAATGLRLDRFYSAHPSCSPTRGSVLTGRHPNRYGTFTPGFSLRPEEITIGHLLGKAGYLRGHFGKWHVGTVKEGSPTNPGAMGFDEWVSHDNFFELDPPLSRNGGPPTIHQGESSAVVIDETIRFIEKAKAQEKPFLAVVWFGSPHEPYSGLAEDLALYDHLPEKYADRDTVSLTSNETGRKVRRPLGEVLRERYAEITAMDRAIGTLRDCLKSKGLRENTVVWYCGDNGTPPSGVLASPLRGMKGQVYEGGTRVPAVIEWPACIRSPRKSTTNAVTSDMLPTLCALTGVPVPDGRSLDGINLVPLLSGNLDQRGAPVFFWQFNSWDRLGANPKPWIDPKLQEGTTPLVKFMGNIRTRNFRNYHYPEPITASDYSGPRVMLGDRYKLVIHDAKGDGDPMVELFDLDADPAEATNLVESKSAIVEAMQTELRTWQQSVLTSLIGADYSENTSVSQVRKNVKIGLIGDSTVAEQSGWGPAFTSRFNEQAKVINYAKNGATLQALSPRLDELVKLKPDYVLIQFGHNDQKRYDTTVYSDHLRSYVERIQKSGGKPVIVSSVTRRSFDAHGKIVSNLIKNEKYSYKANLTAYANAAEAVAGELDLPFIDLHGASIAHHNKIGREESMTYNFKEGDKTHFNKTGAEAITDLILEELKAVVPELAAYLK